MIPQSPQTPTFASALADLGTSALGRTTEIRCVVAPLSLTSSLFCSHSDVPTKGNENGNN
jgi:hypothetical protein